MNVAVKHTSDKQSDGAQSSDEQGQYDQYLPPLSSYEDQSSQPEYGEYDYPDHDYFAGHDVEANDVNIHHADAVDTNVTNADTHAIENSSAEDQPIESHYDARNAVPDTVRNAAGDIVRNNNEIHQGENVAHENSSRESAAHQSKETTDNNYIESQAANNDQKKEHATPAVNVQSKTAPEREANITPVKVPQTINSPVIMATSEVNFDISGLNVDNSTEVALSTEGNFPIAEIDMAAYVDDKMTDPWFLAIKEMQLAGFEKLLAKSCVMQKQGQQIDLILDKSQRHLLNNQDLCEGLKALLRNYYGEQYSISIDEGEAKDGHTPMQLEKIVYQQYLTNAKTSIQHDVMVQTFVSDYAAKVYENSVVPL